MQVGTRPPRLWSPHGGQRRRPPWGFQRAGLHQGLRPGSQLSARLEPPASPCRQAPARAAQAPGRQTRESPLCMSWPQACIFPLVEPGREGCCTPSTWSASISARSSRGALPCPRVATGDADVLRPVSQLREHLPDVVRRLGQLQTDLGIWCSVRRCATTRAATSSALF